MKMQSISNYITEAISQTLKDQLLAIINSDDYNDEDARYLLNVAAPLSKDADSKFIYDQLRMYMDSRYIGGDKYGDIAYDSILHIFQKEDSLLAILSQIITNSNNESSRYTGKALAESGLKGNGNIYDFFSGMGISRNALKKLARLKYDVGNTAQGDFELLTRLLISDPVCRELEYYQKKTTKKSADLKPIIFIKGDFKGWSKIPKKIEGKSGDILTTTDNTTIEYKCPGGRMKNQNIESAVVVQKLFIDIMSKINPDIDCNSLKIICKRGNSSNIYNSIYSLVNNYDIDINIIVNALARVFAEQFNQKENSVVEDIERFFKSHLSKFSKMSEAVFNNEWQRVLGCVQTKYYQRIEGWDYMMIFKGKKGTESIESGDFVTLSKDDVSDLEKIYNNKNIFFDGFLGVGNWESAVHIYA